MTVIVARGIVDDGIQIYHRGESIHGLSEKDEADLIASGSCRRPEEFESEPTDNELIPSNGEGGNDGDAPDSEQDDEKGDGEPDGDGPNTDIPVDEADAPKRRRKAEEA